MDKIIYVNNLSGQTSVQVGGETLPVLTGLHTLDEYEALYAGKLPTDHTVKSVIEHAASQLQGKDVNGNPVGIQVWAEPRLPADAQAKVDEAHAAIDAAIDEKAGEAQK